MSQGHEAVRVIKKGKKAHAGHHGGAWKVAYADFVTAMMAFFLVMWIVGMNQSVKEAIAAYFKDPIGFMRAQESGSKAINQVTPGVLSCPDVTPTIRKDSYDLQKARMAERKRFERVKSTVEKLVAEHPEFKNLAGSIQVRVAQEGLRIDLMESSSDLFFDSGSAQTKPATRDLLMRVAQEVGKLPNSVVLEGHTDSMPFHGPNGWTNWELSAARANAARAVMADAGLRSHQIVEVRGLADTMPIDPQHKDSFKNRRVSILLPSQANVDAGTVAQLKEAIAPPPVTSEHLRPHVPAKSSERIMKPFTIISPHPETDVHK